MVPSTSSGRTWEEASSPAAVRLVRRFEQAWRDSEALGRRPVPDDFLPLDRKDCPGARLALLRADLALRREAGERVSAEWYRERYPDLGDETLVALAYEEFCLREEEQEGPIPAEFLARFPQVAAQLRRVFDIHGLVGSGQTTASHPNGQGSLNGCEGPAIPFPEAGQTIAGFHLVEELGRGAFARVFRAEERQLADRPVALKVARAGSREPQTLARLQHTHIVPIHSSRADPATGLHLLCMPFFGRVTLALLLADPKVKVARAGSDLIAALDRLGGGGPPPSGRSTGRSALGRRTYAQAIAWWGARMAEALEHAHERGVLHRDIKPSNVLVTGDGMPMLLDFNLARETVLDGPGASSDRLGGTLDYMAPEHLEALADGLADRVDARSDLYGLGVVLYESLMGLRPFPAPRGARSAAELLLRAAEDRRDGSPRLRVSNPEVPAALEAVVRRCLEPEPGDRYASAADLAHDLQAVADDRPLKFAREPLASRGVRWARRNRRGLAMLAPLVAALGVAAATLVNRQLDRVRIEDQARQLFDEGKAALRHEDFATAKARFGTAETLAEGRPYLRALRKQARTQFLAARETESIRGKADALFAAAESLRFRLLRFGGDLDRASEELSKVLAPFYVLARNDDWTSLPDLKLLDAARQERLIIEVDKLLFLWAVARDSSGDRVRVRETLPVCDRALVFARSKGPWRALRAWLAARLGEAGSQDPGEGPPSEASALACFQWGLLAAHEGRRGLAVRWLEQAVREEPGDYWYQYVLAYMAHLDGNPEEALRHYDAAVALRPGSPWVRLSRAELYRKNRAWAQALYDLQKAIEGFATLGGRDRASGTRWARFERGCVLQALGEWAGARADFDGVIATDPRDAFGRAARLNRAGLDAESGAEARALDEYEALIVEDPADLSALQGRALLAIRLGRAVEAEADLGALIRLSGGRDDRALADRALARLSRHRAEDALPDAEEALRIAPTPSHERLWTRTLLALRRVRDLRVDRPDDLAILPVGLSLEADLRASADRLRGETEGSGAAALRALLTRAVLLAALRDREAGREADRAVAQAPLAPQVYLVRGRVRRQLGERPAALADARRGLELQPDNPGLWELRGLLESESGDARAGLADFDRAIRLGGGAAIRRPRALALLALGDTEGAFRDWALALASDPEDPRVFLDRARGFARLGQWDQALAELQQVAAWAGDRPGLSLRIVLTAARGLPERPDLFPRVFALARRAWSAARNAWEPRPR